MIIVAVWQRDNLEALRYAVSMSEEELGQSMEENQEEFDAIAREYGIPAIGLTEEELAALESGGESAAEIADRLLSSYGGAVDDGSGAGSQEGSDTSSGDNGDSAEDVSSDTDSEIQRLITSLYVLRSSYTSRLDGLISEASSEFYSLAPESRTDTARRRIVATKISEASSLESSCDAQVESICEQIRVCLSGSGQDTSLADRVMSAYQQEKALKKASYLSQI